MGKGRGTRASPTGALTNDRMGSFTFYAYEGTGLLPSATFRADLIDTTPGTTALGARFLWFCCPIGSATLAETMRLDSATGLSMFGANTVIDKNRLHVDRGFTFAALTALGTVNPFTRAFVTDSVSTHAAGIGTTPTGSGSNKVPVYTVDGTNWLIG